MMLANQECRPKKWLRKARQERFLGLEILASANRRPEDVRIHADEAGAIKRYSHGTTDRSGQTIKSGTPGGAENVGGIEGDPSCVSDGTTNMTSSTNKLTTNMT